MILTCLTPGAGIGKLDDHILQAVQFRLEEPAEVLSQRMKVAIRNEQGGIYRVIGISHLGTYVDTIMKLRELNFVDETERDASLKGVFDVIFAPH